MMLSKSLYSQKTMSGKSLISLFLGAGPKSGFRSRALESGFHSDSKSNHPDASGICIQEMSEAIEYWQRTTVDKTGYVMPLQRVINLCL